MVKYHLTIYGDKLDLNVMQLPIYVLGSYGLENKSRFPNTNKRVSE